MGILLCCLRVPEHEDDESRNISGIRTYGYPITSNVLSKYEELFQNQERGEILSVADDEEDVCPTCFYEYIEDNPKIVLQCGHNFHLSCIYEWMERSEVCPFCSKTMLFLEDDITEQVE